jgi:hypothetical protein
MYITQFGAYTFPTDQIELTETSGAGRRGATSAIGGSGGGWDEIGLGPDPLLEDSISKTLVLEGTGSTDTARKTSLRTQFDALLGEMMTSQNDWRQGYRLLFAILPDGSERCAWAKCVECRARWEYFNLNHAWIPVSLMFKRPWPVWKKHNGGALRYLGDHLGDFNDTASFNLGSTGGGIRYSSGDTASPLNINGSGGFNNPGNARVMDVIFRWQSIVTNPRLTNTRNGHWVQYHGTLAGSDRLTLYSQSMTAKLNGLNAWGNIEIGTRYGQLYPMVVEPGTNDIIHTHDGASGTFFLQAWWADSWL